MNLEVIQNGSNESRAIRSAYQSHLKHLKLKGLQPKTIDAYARAIRRVGDYFDHRIDSLTEAELADYFTDLIGTRSWNALLPACSEDSLDRP